MVIVLRNTGAVGAARAGNMNEVLAVWKDFGEERRQKGASAFYEDASMKDYHRVADGFIAMQKHFRPQFVKKLPVSKRSQYLASMPLSLELAAQLMVAYHFANQRGMMQLFLDSLDVPNDAGLIKEDHELSAPSAEKLSAAVKALREHHPAEDVYLYLATLHSQNEAVWSGLATHLDELRPAA